MAVRPPEVGVREALMLPTLARHFQSAHVDPNGVSQQAGFFSETLGKGISGNCRFIEFSEAQKDTMEA